MKKIFFAASLFLSSLTALQAQVNYGVRGGLSMTTLVGEGYNSKPGFHLGGYLQLPLKNSFQLQPEVYFATQGAKWDGGGKTALTYLHIPILAKYVSASGFFGETGPQAGIMLSAHDSYEGEKEDVKKYLNTTDFSWSFGAGYQFTQKLAANLRYNLGINKFWHDEKNSVLMLGVQYKLN